MKKHLHSLSGLHLQHQDGAEDLSGSVGAVSSPSQKSDHPTRQRLLSNESSSGHPATAVDSICVQYDGGPYMRALSRYRWWVKLCFCCLLLGVAMSLMSLILHLVSPSLSTDSSSKETDHHNHKTHLVEHLSLANVLHLCGAVTVPFSLFILAIAKLRCFRPSVFSQLGGYGNPNLDAVSAAGAVPSTAANPAHHQMTHTVLMAIFLALSCVTEGMFSLPQGMCTRCSRYALVVTTLSRLVCLAAFASFSPGLYLKWWAPYLAWVVGISFVVQAGLKSINTVVTCACVFSTSVMAWRITACAAAHSSNHRDRKLARLFIADAVGAVVLLLAESFIVAGFGWPKAWRSSSTTADAVLRALAPFGVVLGWVGLVLVSSTALCPLVARRWALSLMVHPCSKT
eukprot:PhM_4_TR11860/c0_g1_i1/m.14561